MGLFSKKTKISVNDMSVQMTTAAVRSARKLPVPAGVDSLHSLTVNMAYFYAFLKLQLNSITRPNVANTIIHKSIDNLKTVTRSEQDFINLSQAIRGMVDKVVDNMKFATKEAEDPFMGMSVFYYLDLFESTAINVDVLPMAENNMRELYAMTAALIRNIKIVK